MPDFFGNLIDQILGFARAHEQWLPAIGFRFAFVKSLPLVALFVPGTALLLSIGAVLSGAAVRARLAGHRDRRALTGSPMRGAKVGPALLMAPLRRRRQVRGGFIKRWGVLSIVLCRFALAPRCRRWPAFRDAARPFQAANWASAFLWRRRRWRRAGRRGAGR